MSDIRMIISKSGHNAKTCLPKDRAFDSKFETFKIYRTGTLSLSAPSATITYPASADTLRTATYTHNLGYMPFFMPILPMNNYLDLLFADPEASTISMNDAEEYLIPKGAFGLAGNIHQVNLWGTTTTLEMTYQRTASLLPFPPFNTKTFPAQTITLDYTIFWNKVNQEFTITIN